MKKTLSLALLLAVCFSHGMEKPRNRREKTSAFEDKQEMLTERLHDAIRKGDLEAVKAAQAAGAKLTDKTVFINSYITGGQALHLATYFGHRDIVEWLIDQGASVNARDKESATPLHIAVRNGDLECVKLLLKREAKVDAQTSQGLRASHIAAAKGYRPILEQLIEHGADGNIYHKGGLSPAHFAAIHGHLDVIQTLMGKSDNKDIITSNSPLHLAAQHGNLACVQWIIEHGENRFACNDEGLLPLDVAVIHGHLDIVKELRMLLAEDT